MRDILRLFVQNVQRRYPQKDIAVINTINRRKICMISGVL